MRALQHECPRWETEPNEPNTERYVWPDRMRIVHGQRARKLRKRGVPLLPLHAVRDLSGGVHARGQFEPCAGWNQPARYAWFEPEAQYEARQAQRRMRCYNTWCAAEHGQRGRKAWLATRLYEQRSMLQARLMMRAWRKASPRIAEFWASTHIETATGAALDALCGISQRPPGMTDAEVRAYHAQGYAIRATEPTPEDKAARRSPPLTLFVPRATIVAPENEGGYTYDMSRASLRFECPGCVACPHDGVHPSERP